MRTVFLPLAAGVLGLGCGDQSSPAGPSRGFEQTAEPVAPEPLDVGRVTLHRLNRSEYNNTVRDLLAVSERPADDFPTDDLGYGFDNIADVLSLSPLLLDMYRQAGEQLVDKALAREVERAVSLREAEQLESEVGTAVDDFLVLYSGGSVASSFEAVTSPYRIAVRAYCQQAGPEPCLFSIDVDGLAVATFEVLAQQDAPEVFEVTTPLQAGAHTVGASFLNDYFDPETMLDRNLWLDWVEVDGPLEPPPVDSRARERLLVCDPGQKGPKACAREVLERFASRAYRRPVRADEASSLLALFEAAHAERPDFEQALRTPLQAILLSPHFLFRVELDPLPSSHEAHLLDPFELASRLSYFLWSSMPDEALFEAARSATLSDHGLIEQQVARMLDDPRSEALVENFAGQWLWLRVLDEHEPDTNLFPSFSPALRSAMRAETSHFFASFLRADKPVHELLTADYSYLDESLGRHYGIATAGSSFAQTSLRGAPRAGLLGHASILTLTSNPTRTNPVRRGKWILEQLLCAPPPPPPSDVPGFEPAAEPTATLREQFEAHRANVKCAGCHATLDPLGFGLEAFDAIGTFRTEDKGGFAIDSSGVLPGGVAFDGEQALSAALVNDPRFARCVTQQLLTYALGRGLEHSDRPYVDAITEAWRARGLALRALIQLIATSDPFRMRHGELAGGAP